MSKDQFLTPNEFSLKVEERVMNDNSTYLEAIVSICEDELQCETTDIVGLLSSNLKEKLYLEGTKYHYVKGETPAMLPI